MDQPASRSPWRSFGAALSFYAVVAFPPMVAISIAGLLFGHDVAAEGLLRQLSGPIATVYGAAGSVVLLPLNGGPEHAMFTTPAATLRPTTSTSTARPTDLVRRLPDRPTFARPRRQDGGTR